MNAGSCFVNYQLLPQSGIFDYLPQRNPLYNACVPTRTMLCQLNSDADYEAEIVYLLTQNLLMS